MISLKDKFKNLKSLTQSRSRYAPVVNEETSAKEAAPDDVDFEPIHKRPEEPMSLQEKCCCALFFILLPTNIGMCILIILLQFSFIRFEDIPGLNFPDDPAHAPAAPTSSAISVPSATSSVTSAKKTSDAVFVPKTLTNRCPKADFAQTNMGGIQAHGLVGIKIPKGYIFSWKNDGKRKNVLTDFKGNKIDAGWIRKSDPNWENPGFWKSAGGFTYEISNFKPCDSNSANRRDLEESSSASDFNWTDRLEKVE